jgi:hypothetical protein
MAKHIVTIRARSDFHGLRIYTDYEISKKSTFYLAVKHRKDGDFSLMVFKKTSAMNPAKTPR